MFFSYLDVMYSSHGSQIGNCVSTKDGHIVVASESVHKLSIFSPRGECVHEVKDVGLSKPFGVAVTDDGSIFLGRRKAAQYCFYFHWKCP